MKWTQAVKMAFSAILGNKMRSFLTMLGIIIGVLSVTLLVSLVQGATASVTSQLETLGGNKLMVYITNVRSNYITPEELREMENEGGVGLTAPYISGSALASFSNNSTGASVTGVTPSYEIVEAVSLESGRFIQESDYENRFPVAVVAYDIAMDLFGNTDVIGNRFSMMGRSFEIIGLLEKVDADSFTAESDTVYIPYSTASRLLKSVSVTSFDVSTQSVDSVDQAKKTIQNFLDERIKKAATADEDEKGYSILNMGDILSAFDSVMSTMSLLLGGIAGISLVVGGIGIMNIMLVSVTERTKEIGIRKAIGAKHSDILIQFLIESVAISITGGVIGMVLGALILQIFSAASGMAIALSPSISLLAMLFSLAIGVLFGIYPANKAAKLRPIDALRYE